MTINRPVQALLTLVLAIALVVVAGRGLVLLTGGEPLIGGFGERSERGGCPSTDNCVSSLATEAPWAIEPIACVGSPSDALAATDAAISSLGDVEVTVSGQAYVAYSKVFRFPDDVRVTTSPRGVEILSSSRLGAGDLGVNRARVEEVRTAVAADPRC